ncbi:RNA polymerase rpb3/Rpb11 dimerization domain-containing protein [Ditylenchus destructor]|uniref:DNA-directed RNA polymerase I subunit D n=1 Tax=Ditylenchus destructor TaxID=166010 RepID=A0AAD4R248_9BILA|nr:RNA polymerase rpb3/Rpb11 dimerization domain-containing protein [Ditylenchus destructor]
MDQSDSSISEELLPRYQGQFPKVEILDYDAYRRDPTMVTIVFREEDHTIGNILKDVICKMKGVEFCGYNVPHPLEDKILLRIQTREGYRAGDILLNAFRDLETVMVNLEEKFKESYAVFKSGI